MRSSIVLVVCRVKTRSLPSPGEVKVNFGAGVVREDKETLPTL
jgi:hypothetical protein